ncbi:zinc ABC transporter substrate-binding protein [Thermococcus sp.]|uniref:metal ABC transporter solute-binding protein, Zn/Mn family n=1 Tax=Thermococcus sp. TaxID=35749 RepID=UPI002617B896|nr:zinc ABC transporter substrate-binding protein [Thermococcus sp.]
MRLRALVPVLLLIGMSIPTATAADQHPLVVTTIAPLASIVKEAFGGSVGVTYIIPPGADPHEYQLSADQINLLERADVVVTTGGHLPVEKKIAELVREGTIQGQALFIEDYKAEGFHYLPETWYHGKDNPHGVWLDPYNAISIAAATEKALEKVDPAKADLYRADFQAFRTRVLEVVKAYGAMVEENRTAIIQMPPDEYAVHWLEVETVAAIKPEEEVPAVGVDTLLPKAEKANLIVYGRNSPEQLKKAAEELSEKSGKPTAEITVFWANKTYTDVLIENTVAVLRALGGKPQVKMVQRRGNLTTYVFLSLLVGIMLGAAVGVILKR